jgi:hypothetical protein
VNIPANVILEPMEHCPSHVVGLARKAMRLLTPADPQHPVVEAAELIRFKCQRR